MAGAYVIEAAIGITLLLMVSYVVVGSVITTATVVSNAQKDMNLIQEERLNTNIVVTYSGYSWNGTSGTHDMDFRIKNTGSTRIDYTKLGFVLIGQDVPPSAINIISTGNGLIGSSPIGTWYFEGIYGDESGGAQDVTNVWDPGEFVYGWFSTAPHPVEFHAFTPNGATGYLPVT
jgi:archaellum component FlaG (FlaF/FlaG flagellin family)